MSTKRRVQPDEPPCIDEEDDEDGGSVEAREITEDSVGRNAVLESDETDFGEAKRPVHSPCMAEYEVEVKVQVQTIEKLANCDPSQLTQVCN